MAIRHLLSVTDLGLEGLLHLVKRSLQIEHDGSEIRQPLKGKFVGIYFRGSSTRTRTAFTVGALRLGAQTIAYGKNDLQIATGETVSDTARVLSEFLDVLVIRTNGADSEMAAFASQNRMAVINAMSEREHPTQAIADLATIQQEFGHLDGIHILYVGEGNNTAASLALAVAQINEMCLTLVTPEGYGLHPETLKTAVRLAEQTGARIEQHQDIEYLPTNVNVVYATRWQTMGEPKRDTDWLQKFAPFKVTPALMSRVSGRKTIFMHDLPAVRGEDVLDEVIDGPQSRAFQQAARKLSSAMAVLEWCDCD